MKKISILIILSLLFSVSSVAYAKVETRGNSIGNTANGGIIAESGDYLYYSYEGDGLYKEKKDGTGKVKICDSRADNLNIAGDYIYCNLFDKDSVKTSGIYKIKTDGSKKQKLNSDYADYMNIVGDTIYYSNINDCYKLYKMKLDGSGRKKVNDYPMSNINVIGDWIYFENHIEKGSLYKMKTDGTKMTALSDHSAYRMEINVIGDWIYYIAEYPNTGLYKVKTDGTQREKLSDDQLVGLNVAGDMIYYAIYQDGIYRMKTDGTGNKQIAKTNTMGVSIANGWIYYAYTDYSDRQNSKTGFSRVKPDGSKVENLYSKEGNPKRDFMLEDTDNLFNSMNSGKTMIGKEEDRFLYTVNGKAQPYSSSVAYIGRTYFLPLNEISKLGIPNDNEHIYYNKDNKEIDIRNGDVKVTLAVDSGTMKVNGIQKTIKEAPFFNSSGTVYVPAVVIAEAFGKVMEFDDYSQTILVSDKTLYNMVKEVLGKADAAMKALKSYKSGLEFTYASSGSNVLNETGVYNFETDREHKQLKLNLKGTSNGKTEEYDCYMSDGTAYLKATRETEWKKTKTTGIEYETSFDSMCNLYDLETDILCAGLNPDETTDPANIILRGDIFFEELNDYAGYRMLMYRDTPECSLEIIIDKSTYLVKEIRMEAKATGKTGFQEKITVRYGNFNEKIMIVPPVNIKY